MNNRNSAQTGKGFVSVMQLKPGYAPYDVDVNDLIDAPIWNPTGSHKTTTINIIGKCETFIVGETLNYGMFT